MSVLYNKYFYISTTVLLAILFNFLLFFDIIFTKTNSICLLGTYSVNIEENVWKFIKLAYFIITFLSWSFISYSFFTKNTKYYSKSNVEAQTSDNDNSKLSLKIGKEMNTGREIFIPEKGLYQNLLITGTIGTGKTSSAMYPFLEQLLNQNLGMLILDVKGNFHKKVLELNEKYHRKVIVIELNRKI